MRFLAAVLSVFLSFAVMSSAFANHAIALPQTPIETKVETADTSSIDRYVFLGTLAAYGALGVVALSSSSVRTALSYNAPFIAMSFPILTTCALFPDVAIWLIGSSTVSLGFYALAETQLF